MNDRIEAITRRTQRYWYVDGLNEMAIGIVLAILGLFYLIISALPDSFGWKPWASLVQLVLIFFSIWIASRAVKALKERITYPRTGRVTYPAPQGASRWSRVGLTAGIALVVSALAALVARIDAIENFVNFFIGALAGLAIAYLGYRFRLTRFYLLACCTLVIGALVTTLNLPEEFSSAVVLFLMGFCFFISGGITLVQYLRSTRPAGEQE